jgi:hypothetical protein
MFYRPVSCCTISMLWMLSTAALLSASPIPCTNNSNCHDLQGIHSTCGTDGFCSNPFESGCLYARLPGWTKKRVCNSDDSPDAAEKGICAKPTFDYMEVRINTGNWESITFASWLMQIVLSELLQVPTTLEPAMPNARKNFYEKSGGFDFGSYDLVATIDNAFRYKDCRLASRTEDNYEPCAHLHPEYWATDWTRAMESMRVGSIEPPEALGVVARETT